MDIELESLDSLEDLEIESVLAVLKRRSGYDFERYSRASLVRRLRLAMEEEKLKHMSELIPLILYQDGFVVRLIGHISVPVTEMFRDPEFYHEFRQLVVPHLRTYPRLKLWHAGCASGEEAYSMAILLHQEDLLARTQIYATDFNPQALGQAREGIYSLDRLQLYAKNYGQIGFQQPFSNYYTVGHGAGRMSDELRRHILFSPHNLCTDAGFGEMHVICSRNVLIYFQRALQYQVLELFAANLARRGFLCLGIKESLEFSAVGDQFDKVSPTSRIYRKHTALAGSVA